MSAGPPEVGEIIAGKYRVEGLLGRGGMGVVFKAVHVITGKRFAIKWLLSDPSGGKLAVDRFIREAQVAGRVEHPNIVEVYDVGEARGSLYMVMELLEGESLEARLLTRGAMPVGEAIRIMLLCARGIARAHAAGIVHRDLKPANIFLRRTGEAGGETPKVLDFGISKIADTIEPNSAITKTGTLLGTPFYMAPEQVHAREVDDRTDVYAFGVILYQLVAGRLPFQATTYSSLLVKILTDVPKPLESLVSDLPSGFGPLVRRAMAREPSARFQTMRELIVALERLEAALHARPGRRRARARRGRRAGVIALLFALVGGVVASIWLARGGMPAPRPQGGDEPVAATARAPDAPPSTPPPAHALMPADPEPEQLPRGIDAPIGTPVITASPAPAAASKPTRRPAASGHAAQPVPPPLRPPAAARVPVAKSTADSVPVQGSPPAPAPVGTAAPAPTPEPAINSVPPEADSTPEQPAEAPPRKPAGRLGVQLTKDEF
jgi:eukaryotic-like serine/threonine-protein kinase